MAGWPWWLIINIWIWSWIWSYNIVRLLMAENIYCKAHCAQLVLDSRIFTSTSSTYHSACDPDFVLDIQLPIFAHLVRPLWWLQGGTFTLLLARGAWFAISPTLMQLLPREGDVPLSTSLANFSFNIQTSLYIALMSSSANTDFWFMATSTKTVLLMRWSSL